MSNLGDEARSGEARNAAYVFRRKLESAGANVDESSVKRISDELGYWKGAFHDDSSNEGPEYWRVLENTQDAARVLLNLLIGLRRPDLATLIEASNIHAKTKP